MYIQLARNNNISGNGFLFSFFLELSTWISDFNITFYFCPLNTAVLAADMKLRLVFEVEWSIIRKFSDYLWYDDCQLAEKWEDKRELLQFSNDQLKVDVRTRRSVQIRSYTSSTTMLVFPRAACSSHRWCHTAALHHPPPAAAFSSSGTIMGDK